MLLTKNKNLKIEINLEYVEFEDLDSVEQNLVESSILASKSAYAPYSKFNVGAAALLQNGEVVIGSNQENAAYPSGLCAERVALFACGAQFKDQIISHLAVYVDSFENDHELPMPCGSCRQVMNQSEFRQNSPIKILLITKSKNVYVAQNTEQLLPFPFRF